MADQLPPPIEATPSLKPVAPPPGSPDHGRQHGASAPTSAETQKPASAPPPVAVLDFVAERTTRIPLSCPFQLDGQLIDTIVVRRLPVIAVSNLVADDRYRDLYEVYSEMTGLPAPVLRGLDADDGERVTEAAWSFLPRLLATVHDSSSL